MSEIFKIILTSSLTVIGGIVVLVFGQIVIKFIIEPFQEQAKLRAEIAESIIFYANVGSGIEQYYFQKLQETEGMDEPLKKLVRERYEEIIKNNWKKSDDAATKLRQQAGQLLAKTYAIPGYGFWAFLGALPSSKNIAAATSNLIGMSNSVHDGRESNERIKDIARQLRLKIVLRHIGAK